jgi:hypothetical protein
MESPFPGMDPYLERYWTSVHTQLAGAASRALNRVLPNDLSALPEERLQIASAEDLEHVSTLIADATVSKSHPGQIAAPSALSAPFTLVLDYEPGTERYVKILARGDRLVTVIEFLSPSNKTGDGLSLYLKKRDELLDAGVHVVEVDLVRKGNWRALLEPHLCPAEALAEYRGVIRLGKQRRISYVYPWPIRRPIEPLPIPLRQSDPVVTLDVQQLLRDVYADDRYAQRIDYAESLQPPLANDTAEWVRELLTKRGIITQS